jgi:hypothetical protein
MKDGESRIGFDIEGIFTAHMVSISYNYVFTKEYEITEGAYDNEETHLGTRVVATTTKIVPKKRKHVTHYDTNT